MKHEFKKGDKVRVNDPGLAMIMSFMPKGTKPNNEGVVYEIRKDGYLEIWFPIGDDDPEQHSQAAIYPIKDCQKIG